MKLCHWIRSVKPEACLKKDAAMAATGDWRCAARYDTVGWEGGACLQKWGDGDGHGRVLVINREDGGVFTDGKKYAMYFLGPDRKPEDEFLIQMLRAATLLEKIPESQRVLVDGKLPAEDIVSAIEELNQSCEKSLQSLAECRNLRSCNHKEFKERCPHREPYCCDARLSFAAGGCPFKGLYVPKDTEVIDSGFKSDLLACMIAYHDFAGLEKPKKAGPKRNAYWYVQAAGPYWLENRKHMPWDHPAVSATALGLLGPVVNTQGLLGPSAGQPTAVFVSELVTV